MIVLVSIAMLIQALCIVIISVEVAGYLRDKRELRNARARADKAFADLAAMAGERLGRERAVAWLKLVMSERAILDD